MVYVPLSTDALNKARTEQSSEKGDPVKGGSMEGSSAKDSPQAATMADAPCPIPRLDCGMFRTTDIRSWKNPEHVTIGEVPFKMPSSFPPTVLLGISKIDVNILRLKAEVRTVADDRAIINMSTWANTKHYLSGCSWLTILPDDPDIQSGRYNTAQDHHWSTSQKKTSRRITFARSYATPPKVVVWLDAIDSGPGRNARVTAWADQVTVDGFVIHLDTWLDSNLWSAGATWLAHSANRTDVRSGSFEVSDVRPPSAPRLTNRGRVAWGAPAMARPPRVFAAINMLDFQDGRSIRLKLETSEITTTGMSWNLDSWADSIFHQAGAVYVAFIDG